MRCRGSGKRPVRMEGYAKGAMPVGLFICTGCHRLVALDGYWRAEQHEAPAATH